MAGDGWLSFVRPLGSSSGTNSRTSLLRQPPHSAAMRSPQQEPEGPEEVLSASFWLFRFSSDPSRPVLVRTWYLRMVAGLREII